MEKTPMIGKRFGKLEVIEEVGRRKQYYWYLVKCECGTKIERSGADLRKGKSFQCHLCTNRSRAKKLTTHGRHKDPIYHVWAAMIQRCTNPNHINYHRYGGRGIEVCERWRKFENFLKDMGERPEGLTLDRQNNNGNYEPSNCRWVTSKENCNNRGS